MIFRSLYRLKMRAILGLFASRAELDDLLAPISQMSEREAFESLFFPARAIARADRNNVIGLKNLIGRASKEAPSSATAESPVPGEADRKTAPSNPTVERDARKSGARPSP